MEDIDAAFSQVMNRDLESEDNAQKAENSDDEEVKRSSPGPAPPTSRITLSGLLNALDGVGAQEGRILFATTNKYSSLDPALCRPGRMDIHIQFKLASRYQARELYRCFYLPDSEVKAADAKKLIEEKEATVDSGYSSADEKASSSTTQDDLSETSSRVDDPLAPEPVIFSGHSHRRRAPALTPAQVAALAAQFAEAIPEREFSMAALQGYLMAYKVRPYDAVKDAAAWVEKERADMAKKAAAKAAKP